MALDVYSTTRLLMAVQGIDPAHSFLRDRYFPATAGSNFASESVLVEYRDGDMRLAPFVAPRKGGVTLTREGEQMKSFMPAKVAPKRPISIDDITKRGFGESIYGDLTPEQRAQVLAVRDLTELDHAITRREEAMAAEVMTTNGCIMKAIGDDATNTIDSEIHFYDESTNPATMTFTKKWGASDATIIDDLASMADALTSKGLPATDFVCSPDVAAAIINNAQVQKLLDIRRFDMGNVAPSFDDPSAATVAVLNIYGQMINIISYNKTYTDDKGKVAQYIAKGTGVMTAPGAGTTLYGAVSQVEQADGEFHTYTGSRVPQYISSAEGGVRTLTLTARPLLVPVNKNPFISATSLLA